MLREVEKCAINTRPGVKILKRGKIIPQDMRKQAIEYFEDLERRGVIRKSQ
jgi:hypothetical protein